MQDERASAVLQTAYHQEQDADAKAQMLYIAHSLTPEIGRSLLQEAMHDPQPAVQQTAQMLLARQK
jgi:hypothetical protein